MEAIGPGTLLRCVAWKPLSGSQIDCGDLTVGSIYRCNHVSEDPYGDRCPWDDCGTVGVALVDRFCNCLGSYLLYCPNFFRPLNDGDTSLVETEREDDSPLVREAMNILDEEFAKESIA